MRDKWTSARLKLLEAIESGRFRPGSALPPLLELAEEKSAREGLPVWGSYHAVQRAAKSLVAEGVLRQDPNSRRGRFFVPDQDRQSFETYREGFERMVAIMREYDRPLEVCLSENWLPSVGTPGKFQCEMVDRLAQLAADRSKRSESMPTSFRLMCTWPGDTGSLMRRIWTRRDCWELHSSNERHASFAGYMERARNIAAEIACSNDALTQFASDYPESVYLRYSVSWPSSPMLFGSKPFRSMLVGMYHGSQSSYDSPAAILGIDSRRCKAHRTEFEDYWELSQPFIDLKHQFDADFLQHELAGKFSLTYREFLLGAGNG